MSGIEVAGLVLTTLPIILGGFESLQRAWPDFKDRCAEHGTLLAVCLSTIFPDALKVMSRVELSILQAHENEVMTFMESHTTSFGMIGVAGAIVAQVAITAMSLTQLENSHWTAVAFFVVSLVTGALSVFFSCLINPAFHGLHSADDIKDFLSKPVSSMKWNELSELLAAAELSSTLSEEDRNKIKLYVTEHRWQVASPWAAIMLVAPLKLLKAALNSFLVGLGIYLGKLYTANLIPAYGNGSLGILIIFIATAFTGIALYYLPRGYKAVEHEPVIRFRRLIHGTHSRKSYGKLSKRGFQHSIAVARLLPGVRPQEIQELLSTMNRIIQKSPSLKRHLPTELQEFLDRYSPRTIAEILEDVEGIPMDVMTGSASIRHPQETARAHTADPRVSMDPPSGGPSQENTVHSALQSLIQSQEESLRASRRLLDAFQSSCSEEQSRT